MSIYNLIPPRATEKPLPPLLDERRLDVRLRPREPRLLENLIILFFKN